MVGGKIQADNSSCRFTGDARKSLTSQRRRNENPLEKSSYSSFLSLPFCASASVSSAPMSNAAPLGAFVLLVFGGANPLAPGSADDRIWLRLESFGNLVTPVFAITACRYCSADWA